MKTQIAVVLRKRTNKEGLYPLAVRITKNRIAKYRQIGIYIQLDDWDNKNSLVKPSHPDANHLNVLIAKSIFKVRQKLNSKKSKDTDFIICKRKKKTPEANIKPTFFEFTQQHLDELKALNKFSRLSSDSAYVSYIKAFHKNEQLLFKNIDEHFLIKLKIYLKKNRSLSETSIMNVLVFIRAIYNKAIKQKIAKRKLYPFGSDKIQIKFPESRKIGLNKWEVMLLE